MKFIHPDYTPLYIKNQVGIREIRKNNLQKFKNYKKLQRNSALFTHFFSGNEKDVLLLRSFFVLTPHLCHREAVRPWQSPYKMFVFAVLIGECYWKIATLVCGLIRNNMQF